jgi:tripartite-type tricarboxylate transporter receptor subunit TctC
MVLIHVPYRGAAPAILELLGGRLPVVFVDLFSLLPYSRKGDIRIIAVTSPGRAQIALNIPTAAEQGVKDLDVTAWLGLFAPARTSDSVVNYVQKLVASVSAQREFISKMAQSGAEMVASSPAEFSEYFQRELTLYRNVSRQGNITLD